MRASLERGFQTRPGKGGARKQPERFAGDGLPGLNRRDLGVYQSRKEVRSSDLGPPWLRGAAGVSSLSRKALDTTDIQTRYYSILSLEIMLP